MTKTVIAAALFGIGKHRVGLGRFLEFQIRGIGGESVTFARAQITGDIGDVFAFVFLVICF